ncbi:MAG TPA: histidine kinase dimerization/phospho-acceptor domain-containing protein [Puia sp.]|nr:histidine kinase dimerization/phospho-acceptor domain-containing protein [Puia sp.]
MKTSPFVLFRRIYLVIFLLIALLGVVFIGITYIATTNFYEASTQLLNKDVAAHIARFTSPYGREGFDRRKADSVFYEAMVISPSAEVYFLDTAGNVIYFHGDPGEVKSRMIPLEHILRYLRSDGTQHIDGPDPRDPARPKIFSAAAVEGDSGRLGYIYVVLGSAQYRSVTQMLYNSRVTPVVLGSVAAILAISLLVTLLYLHRMRLRFDELVNMMGKRFREGDFLVNLSHDLRTPLAIARGYGETLLLKKAELSDAQARGYTELVVEKIVKVEGIVNQLFELAKIESPNFEPRREPFLFSEMMGEVLRAVGARQRVELSGGEDGAWIEADVAMMERVVQNLLVNALAYTPATGRIALSLAREGGELAFRIENEGAALPEDLLHWINEPGAGRPVRPAIGLTIVRRIIALHGYRFRAQSAEGINRFEVRMRVYR